MDCHFLPPKNALDTRPYESEKAGIRPFEKGHIRFGYPDGTYPILMIDKYLYDDENQINLPIGYYEVGLSNDKKFILLSQSKKLIAVVPVYHYEEIISDEKEQKKEEKKKKERQKQKEAADARLTSQKYDIEKVEKRLDVYAKLIDYDKDYFIIEYRRYNIKAYGAIPKDF